jgi:hypothetical protein
MRRGGDGEDRPRRGRLRGGVASCRGMGRGDGDRREESGWKEEGAEELAAQSMVWVGLGRILRRTESMCALNDSVRTH